MKSFYLSVALIIVGAVLTALLPKAGVTQGWALFVGLGTAGIGFAIILWEVILEDTLRNKRDKASSHNDTDARP